ncbi:MAG: bifunctional 5,10-methylenetetrahydrofolate dehydrogenase/5,10-methenyltetrahydrofolate cyclohydrolase [Candidatus Methanomethylophilaceae archaeon]
MAGMLIDGKRIAGEIQEELAREVGVLKEKGVTPGLAVILVGEDPASQMYVQMKGRTCRKLGMHSETIILPESTPEGELLERIEALNGDPAIHGILVQLPLPSHIREERVIDAIHPSKDVDAFHPYNVGRMFVGSPIFLPATPAGIQQLLLRSGVETAGKRVVVVGRSNIVGKPIAAMLMQKGPGGDATVTLAHSRTRDLAHVTREAEILIVAVGKANFITRDMVRSGAVVIDAGTNKVADPSTEKGYRWVGDVDFQGVQDLCAAITPVPGGVGPMTIAMLMANTLRAAELSR